MKDERPNKLDSGMAVLAVLLLGFVVLAKIGVAGLGIRCRVRANDLADWARRQVVVP